MKILVINGPNLNMLGIREPAHYGRETYADLLEKIRKHCARKGVDVSCYQSNHEGCLVDEIQKAYGVMDGIVINPGAYTHTSIAILDAVKAVGIPTVEVHISKIEELLGLDLRDLRVRQNLSLAFLSTELKAAMDAGLLS